MSDDQLSDDELDALISDLEGRSDGQGGGTADLDAEMPDDEELQALLEGEGEGAPSSSSAETKVAEREAPDGDVGPDLSGLDVPDELPAETGEASQQPTPASDQPDEGEEPSEAVTSTDESSGETEDSGGKSSNFLAYLLVAGKWSGYLLPVVAFWWMLGAYLAQWISAGWLIAVVATLFTVAIPKALYDAADQRGKFRWWLAGASLVLTVVMVAPMPEAAGSALAQYGHWPATMMTEIVGIEGSVLVDANQAVGEWIGGALNSEMPLEQGAYRTLGE